MKKTTSRRKKLTNIIGNIGNVVKSVTGSKIRYFVSGETTDYDSFHFFTGNRIPKQYNINKLIESIQTIGVMRYIIVCSTDMFDGIRRNYIIDGQHLYLACKTLGVPFRYIVVENINHYDQLIEITSRLNSTGVKWSLDTYVNAFARTNDDYAKLKDFRDKQDISYSVLLPLLTGKTLSICKKDVVQGKFKVTQLTKANLFLRNRALVLQYLKESRYTDEGLFTFSLRTEKPVNFHILLNEMERQEAKLRKLPTFGKRDEAEQLFVNLYAKGLKAA
jgi:hypothetical protein